MKLFKRKPTVKHKANRRPIIFPMFINIIIFISKVDQLGKREH
jgi:hypothetical protein